MKSHATSRAGRMLPVLVLAAALLAPVATANAQGRSRTGSADSSRVDRQRQPAPSRADPAPSRTAEPASRPQPERGRTAEPAGSPAPERAPARTEPARSPAPERAPARTEPARTPAQDRSPARTETSRTPAPSRTEPARTPSQDRSPTRTETSRAPAPSRTETSRTPSQDRSPTRTETSRTPSPDRGRTTEPERARTPERSPARTETGRTRTSDRAPQATTPANDGRRPTGTAGGNETQNRAPQHAPAHGSPPHSSHYARPRIHVDIDWPWEYRHRHAWAPRYRYRQVVFFEAGWGHRNHRSGLDVRTEYSQRIRRADGYRAEVDIFIERISLYEGGRFIGEVHHIPEKLGQVRAVLYRDGGVQFDRDIFIVGDRYSGFEMISTRHYDGYVLDAYRSSHGLRAGVLDLRRGRVKSIRRSRLFNPRSFNGFVPVSLLPDDTRWLGDYGYDSYSGRYLHNRDAYYDGGYDNYGDTYYDYREADGANDARPHVIFRDERGENAVPLQHSGEQRFRTEGGIDIRMQRETEFERID